ncbi:MAG: hypothetical protein K6F35_03185 [Lachnospiraceae bacterium]|nr:hypothetical protein [Lachnospiraceae bacterium]
MADFKFTDLKKEYEDFDKPVVQIFINEQEIKQEETDLAVSEIEVELSSGFEAGIAIFRLVGAYVEDIRQFNVKKCKEVICLGSTVHINMGYGISVRNVFRGFIARVHFIVPRSDSEDVPAIEITAMDAKAAMMANRRSRRLKAMYYSDAVREVLEANAFVAQKDSKSQSFTELVINDTPDKASGGGSTDNPKDIRVEMVEESDYEFIVKAAKKFNFEFFIVGKNLYFVEAKKNKDILIELDGYDGMFSLDVGYDMTGLVRKVSVRNVESDKGQYIGKDAKLNSKVSMGNKATPLIEKQTLVYLDTTVATKEEAGYRAAYLKEMVDYRLGSIEMEMVGLPELVPGRFIKLINSGKPLNNSFYLTRVRHVIDQDGYRTEFEGQANVIGGD